MLEKTVSTFDVKVPYDEWVGKFDNDEAPAISAIGIKVIFRGVSKDNPEKAIVLVQAKEDVLGKHIQENIEIFETMMQSLVLLNLVSGLEDPHCLGINKESNQKIRLN